MANFFKGYQAQVRADREAKEKKKEKPIEYNKGQVAYINPMYDAERNGKRYFAEDLGNGMVLLAKTKKEAMGGYGYIHSRCDIIK